MMAEYSLRCRNATHVLMQVTWLRDKEEWHGAEGGIAVLGRSPTKPTNTLQFVTEAYYCTKLVTP
jgi:hypothetical protein